MNKATINNIRYYLSLPSILYKLTLYREESPSSWHFRMTMVHKPLIVNQNEGELFTWYVYA